MCVEDRKSGLRPRMRGGAWQDKQGIELEDEWITKCWLVMGSGAGRVGG